MFWVQALALLEDEYKVIVMRVNVLGEDSDKKIKQMKTFSGRNTVPQVMISVLSLLVRLYRHHISCTESSESSSSFLVCF